MLMTPIEKRKQGRIIANNNVNAITVGFGL